jgi:hypothetical protein
MEVLESPSPPRARAQTRRRHGGGDVGGSDAPEIEMERIVTHAPLSVYL